MPLSFFPAISFAAMVAVPGSSEAAVITLSDAATYPTENDPKLELAWPKFARSTSPTEGVAGKIRRLGEYRDGWHNEDSSAPARSAIENAENFARQFDWGTLSIPTISLAEDGEVNFFWSNAQVYIDLGFYGDGRYSFFAKDASGKVVMADSVPLSDISTKEFIASLIAGE